MTNNEFPKHKSILLNQKRHLERSLNAFFNKFSAFKMAKLRHLHRFQNN